MSRIEVRGISRGELVLPRQSRRGRSDRPHCCTTAAQRRSLRRSIFENPQVLEERRSRRADSNCRPAVYEFGPLMLTRSDACRLIGKLTGWPSVRPLESMVGLGLGYHLGYLRVQRGRRRGGG